MKLRRTDLVLFAALAVATFGGGCSKVALQNGAKACGTDPNMPCPSGYDCHAGTCWLPNTYDASADVGAPTADGSVDTSRLEGGVDAAGGSDGGTAVQPPKVTITVQRGGDGTVTGNGVDCTDAASCTLMVDSGSSLVLTAIPGSDSTFTIWSGCTSANGASCTLTNVTTSTQVTASFALKSANVVVVKDGNGTGTVAATWTGGGSFSCGAACSAVIPKNTTVTLQATADTGSTFAWNTAGCTGTGACMITTGDAPMNVGVTFTLIKETLTVNRTGDGTITGTGNVSCTDPTCAISVNYGQGITLTAVPASDADFDSWTGCSTANGTTCVVSGLEMAATVSATFKPKKIAVTIQLSGNGSVATADNSVSCTPATATAGACTVLVASGTALVLTATPGSDSDFKTWSGCTTTSGTTCMLSAVTAPATLGATFAIKNASFVISRQGNGSGTVTATWQGGSISCGTTCSANIPQGTAVTVVGTPASSESTLAFSGLCSGGGTCMLTVPSGGTTVVATFTLVKYALTIAANGSGSVTGTGVNCTTFPCTDSLDSGSSITLTAVASSQYTFTGWSGCSSTSASTCTVSSILAAKTVTATFTLNTYPVTVQVVGTGTVTGTGVNCASPSCISNVNSGTSLTLTATADPSYNFAGWSGACTNATGTCSLSSITTATTVTATFTLKNGSLTISKGGNGGTGTVAASWAGGGSLNCGTSCSASIAPNTQVTLTATAGTGSTFASWSNATGCSTSATCVVTIPAAGSVNPTANFNVTTYLVQVSIAGPANSGSVVSTTQGVGINCGATCAATVNYGTSVTLVASPGQNSAFVSWSGCSSVTGTQCTINVMGAASPKATFIRSVAGSCTGAADCSTGFCVGGVCCATACNGECDQKTCAGGACAELSGTKCTGTLTGPGFESHPAYYMCDGHGSCKPPTVTSCGPSAQTCPLSAGQWCCNVSSDYSDVECRPYADCYETFYNCSGARDCPTGYVCCGDSSYVDFFSFCAQTTCPMQQSGGNPIQVCTAGSGTSECTQAGTSCKVLDSTQGYNTCQ